MTRQYIVTVEKSQLCDNCVEMIKEGDQALKKWKKTQLGPKAVYTHYNPTCLQVKNSRESHDK